MHGAGNFSLTPTQIASHERSKAFRAKIADMAARLNAMSEAPLPPPVFIAEPEPLPVPELPKPKQRRWFQVVDDQPVKLRFPMVAQIIEIVAEQFKISVNDILSNRRMAEIVRPRQIAMYLTKEMTERTLPAIGRRFGGRDHTTVLFAVRKIARLIESDPDLAKQVADLKALIEERTLA